MDEPVWLLMGRGDLERGDDAVGGYLNEFQPNSSVESVGEILFEVGWLLVSDGATLDHWASGPRLTGWLVLGATAAGDAARGGRQCFQSWATNLALAVVAGAVGVVRNLFEGTVDIGDRSGDGSGRRGGGQAFNGFGRSLPDPFTECDCRPGRGRFGESSQLGDELRAPCTKVCGDRRHVLRLGDAAGDEPSAADGERAVGLSDTVGFLVR